MNNGRRWGYALLALSLLVSATGCGTLFGRRESKVPTKANLLAVFPLQRDEVISETEAGAAGSNLPLGAENVVSAQLYGVLASRSRWRLVSDLTAEDALRRTPKSGSLEERARALGEATKADVVLCGTISRFRERVGSQFGARTPAAVAFELELVSTETGEVLWRGAFNETQKPLAYNLFNWWMFWQAGPRWFSAREFARLGAEKLIDDLDSK